MRHSDFVHLHVHSDYSLLDGAGSIPAYIKRATELNMPALALTDHGSMFGAVFFYKMAIKSGIKPLVGCELYVTRGSRFDKKAPKRGAWEQVNHIIVLARDMEGYLNLMKLSSLGYTEGFYYRPRIDKQILAAQIRIDIAEKELANHDKQIENAKKIEEFLHDKFTNEELYAWMRGEIPTIYFQCYQF